MYKRQKRTIIRNIIQDDERLSKMGKSLRRKSSQVHVSVSLQMRIIVLCHITVQTAPILVLILNHQQSVVDQIGSG